MKSEKLEAVKTEMKRMAKAINDLESAEKDQANEQWKSLLPRQTGAVRRASMDLTRALADLRKY